MCGIIGYFSSSNIEDKLIKSLKELEYRGYDSCGVGSYIDNKPYIIKTCQRVQELEKLVTNKFNTCYGIGHTRWATHGQANLENAHPHISNNKQIMIVHNGIIENYLELKKKYLSQYKFYSSTDTEVICGLLEIFYQDDFINTIRKVKKLLKGSYSICIINQKEERIYFLKNQTPLIIGLNKDLKAISSDVNAFDNSINKVIYLKDGEYGYIDKTIKIYLANNKEKKYQFVEIEKARQQKNQNIYKTHLEQEILEQVEMIKNIKKHYFKNKQIIIDNHIKELLSLKKRYVIVACGSSYYASLIGKYFFQKYLNKHVEVVLASEAIYNFPLYDDKTLFIFVSQSGETLDVLNVLKKVKKKHIPNIGITNSRYSSLVRMCDYSLNVYAGKEISVASTKAFLGQCLIFLLLASKEYVNLTSLEKEIKRIYSLKDQINELSKKVIKYQHVFFLGRDIDFIIALEGSLKLKEISYIHAEAFSGGELKHGTLSLIDENSLTIALISQKNINKILRVNIQEIKSRKGKVINIVNYKLKKEEDLFFIKNLPNNLMCFGGLIYLQLLALYAATNKGNDVDKPRNLAKSVTVE